MTHLLTRAYAAQRQISFRRDMHRKTREFARPASESAYSPRNPQ